MCVMDQFLAIWNTIVPTGKGLLSETVHSTGSDENSAPVPDLKISINEFP